MRKRGTIQSVVKKCQSGCCKEKDKPERGFRAQVPTEFSKGRGPADVVVATARGDTVTPSSCWEQMDSGGDYGKLAGHQTGQFARSPIRRRSCRDMGLGLLHTPAFLGKLQS